MCFGLAGDSPKKIPPPSFTGVTPLQPIRFILHALNGPQPADVDDPLVRIFIVIGESVADVFPIPLSNNIRCTSSDCSAAMRRYAAPSEAAGTTILNPVQALNIIVLHSPG